MSFRTSNSDSMSFRSFSSGTRPPSSHSSETTEGTYRTAFAHGDHRTDSQVNHFSGPENEDEAGVDGDDEMESQANGAGSRLSRIEHAFQGLAAQFQERNTNMAVCFDHIETSIGRLSEEISSQRTAIDQPGVQTSVADHPSTPRPSFLRVKRRTVDNKSLCEMIRKEVNTLLHLSKTKPVPDPQDLPSAQELSTFKLSWNSFSESVDKHPPCCTSSNFKVDLVGPPQHPWNESASRVFSVYFVERHPQYNSLVVQRAFYTRIKCLKRSYVRNLEGPAAKERARKAARRYARKKQLFTRRMETLYQHSLLQGHIPMLEKLGVVGMSSDESDMEDSQKADSYNSELFHVCRPLWRSEYLTEWLKALDSMHMRMRAKRGQGSLPRLRIRSNDCEDSDIVEPSMSSGKFVDGLPKNSYNEKWLADHIGLGFARDVHPSPEDYNFIIDSRLFSLLNFHGVRVSASRSNVRSTTE